MDLGKGSIRTRIYAGFSVVLALLAVELGLGLRGLARIDGLRQETADEIDPPVQAASDLEHGVLYRAISVRNFVAGGDPRHVRDYERRLAMQQQTLDLLDELELDPASRAARDALAPAARDHIRATGAFLALFGQSASPEELARGEGRLAQAREAFLTRIKEFAALQGRRQMDARARMATLRTEVAATLVVAALLIAIALGVTAVLTTRAVRRPAVALVGAAGALERGDYAPALSLAPAGGAAPRRGGELAALGAAFGRMADALRRREQRLSAEGRLGTALAGPLDAEATAASALDEVIAYTGAELGAVYLADEDSLLRVADRAGQGLPQRLPRAGVLAQALSSGIPVAVDGIPGDLPFTLDVGFGALRPRSVLAVPLSSRGERIGVLLLGSLASLEGDAAAFAERAGGHLAIALQNALAHRRVAAIAEELRDRNERLQAQNEELQAQGEEIQAQSEELHAQAEEIRRHNEDLASAQDALAAKARALEEVDRRKNEFLATLGHELRNPLAAVATAGRLLQAETPHGAPGRHAAIVSRQVRHLRRLVDDLLDLSRINHGKIELRPERLDLVAVLDGAVHAILADATAKRQHVSFRGGGVPLPVDGDPVRLEQVVSNLLRNALKYTPEGGTISVAVEVEAGDAVIRVGDTGVGIPPELLPRIFEPFIQGVHSEGGEQGLGLGLALVQRLVELHGGTVAARSDGAGTGTVFVVRLPLASGAARAATAGREPLPAQEARLQILVVEDNPDVAESTSDALEMFGYAVRIEPDAEAGLRACIERPPDVALLDIGLPGRSGYDLARDIRARLPVSEVRLVAVTGYGQPEDRARSADAGFDHHLVKPVDLDELRSVIERLAAKKLVDAAA